MSDSVVTHVDRPYGQQPETRTAAFAHMVRGGHADILAALGLADVPAPDVGVCPYCSTRLVALCVWHGEHAIAPPPVLDEPATRWLECGHERPADGRSACRQDDCPAGPKSRAAARRYRVVNGKLVCSVCTRRVQADGVCRRPACGGAR